MQASAAPAFLGNPKLVDPEEAFVASVSSCHMLWYLSLAAGQGFQVDSYDDEAVGVMSKNEAGVLWISDIQLRPKIAYSGEKLPAAGDEERLHHMAHERCFIANSVKTRITVGGA